MLLPMSPVDAVFLAVETRERPMHVGALQLFEPPPGATALDLREAFDAAATPATVAPVFAKRPRRTLGTLGQWAWEPDRDLDLEHHVRNSALASPGRVRELLALCSRLHATLLDRNRPLWEVHLIEGLADGRFAAYLKIHHALMDGVSALRMLADGLSTDPDRTGMPAPWAAAPRTRPHPPPALTELPVEAIRTAWHGLADAAGVAPAVVRAVQRGRNSLSAPVSFAAPHSMLNVSITASRRFAAQSWPLPRLRAVGAAAGASVNDVVLAMCSGALRRYLEDFQALPNRSLIAMVPVSLRTGRAWAVGQRTGNAIGAVMCRLGTELPDPAQRLAAIMASMSEGKSTLAGMTQLQILATTAVGMSPVALWPALGLTDTLRPPFNLIISNVPGPRRQQYWNQARLEASYPLSIPLDGQALNITTTSYADRMAFGLTGCRRRVPHLQRLLGYLDEELAALELAAGA